MPLLSEVRQLRIWSGRLETKSFRLYLSRATAIFFLYVRRGPAFPSAPGPSAVSGRSENLRQPTWSSPTHSPLLLAVLIAVSRNCQPASPPGLQPPPFDRGARSPLLLAPQTARCACSRHKNVRGCTDSLNQASSAAHLMLCSWVRILGAPIFKMGENLTFEYALQESRHV